jgi:hypothetical protein
MIHKIYWSTIWYKKLHLPTHLMRISYCDRVGCNKPADVYIVFKRPESPNQRTYESLALPLSFIINPAPEFKISNFHRKLCMKHLIELNAIMDFNMRVPE